jgi:uncharacterized membrane protein YfcA
MFSELINFILIVGLAAIQSIVGVGVLVVGTPTLLLLNLPMIEIMNFLLPISILTSLLNIIIIKKQNNFFYNFDRLKNFFKLCIPSVFIGLIILKYLDKLINFDYVVSFIIILTLLFRENISKIFKKISKRINKIILVIIGIIHGMTNSGGSLLSIMMMNLNKSKKNSRSEITLFYFILALLQFFLLYLIFGVTISIDQFYITLVYIVIGVVLGNVLLKFTKESLYQNLVYILAFISSTTLILKNII